MNCKYDFGSLGVNESNKAEYIEMLGFDQKYFVPAQYINMDKVSIEIEYDLSGLYSYEQLNGMTPIFKLQAMSSLVDLALNTNHLMDINLINDNLYFGRNTNAYQLVRVINPKQAIHQELVNEVKALTGNLFLKESYESILSSNGQLLAKNDMLKGLAEIETLADLKVELDRIIEAQITDKVENKVVVEKNYVNKNKTKGRMMVIMITILAVVTIFLSIIYIPNRTTQLNAIDSYEAGMYEDVLANLADTNVSTMSPVIKYIMAESTVKISQLSDTQKDNILYNLSPSVEENVLDFWVYIGQNDLERAYDQSIKNNDAQQKAYVLLLLIDQTQNDTDLKTEEKESLLSTYQGELESITGSIETAKEIEEEK